MSVECTECGAHLASSGSIPLQGKPCPECGSIRRRYILSAESGGFSLDFSKVSLTHVKTYYETRPWALALAITANTAGLIVPLVVGPYGLAVSVLVAASSFFLPQWRVQHRETERR